MLLIPRFLFHNKRAIHSHQVPSLLRRVEYYTTQRRSTVPYVLSNHYSTSSHRLRRRCPLSSHNGIIATTTTITTNSVGERHFVAGVSPQQKMSLEPRRHYSKQPPPPPPPPDEISALLQGYPLDHADCNVTQSVANKVGRNLHLQPNHPLNTIKQNIETYWKSRNAGFEIVDDLSPVVSTKANFDSLRIEPNHVSRSKSDTYYLNDKTVLRTHTSAHQVDLIQDGKDLFLVSGDVYRRDEIDSSHYPVFHQMEGVKIIPESEFIANGLFTNQDRKKYAEEDLKQGLEGMVRQLFGDVEMKWSPDSFPFTHPSWELEIYFDNEWLEVLGCGVVHDDVFLNSRRVPGSTIGWAFGLGLERLAMILFSIPDIRLFWTNDERFHSQFRKTTGTGEAVTIFQPYSKYPPCHKDVSFWIMENDDNDNDRKVFHVNELMEIVRNVAGDLVEKVHLQDEFVHPKTGLTSHCYRISFRSMDKSLTNEEVDKLQESIRFIVGNDLNVKLR